MYHINTYYTSAWSSIQLHLHMYHINICIEHYDLTSCVYCVYRRSTRVKNQFNRDRLICRYSIYEVPDRKWGGVEADGRWNGMVAQVKDGVCTIYILFLRIHTSYKSHATLEFQYKVVHKNTKMSLKVKVKAFTLKYLLLWVFIQYTNILYTIN